MNLSFTKNLLVKKNIYIYIYRNYVRLLYAVLLQCWLNNCEKRHPMLNNCVDGRGPKEAIEKEKAVEMQRRRSSRGGCRRAWGARAVGAAVY